MRDLQSSPSRDAGLGIMNFPVIRHESVEKQEFCSDGGAHQYSVPLAPSISLDTLLLNKHSSVLVVALHGALLPGKDELPRFEWLRTFQQADFSSFYISDPTLYVDENLRLGWYVGWREVDLFPILARAASRAAEAAGADTIVFTGTSGGGYASLQISSLLPNSLAVPFNPQTDISRYNWGAQAAFLKRVMPELDNKARRDDWAKPLGWRASAIERYRTARDNYILYAQNMNDNHHRDEHYHPFRSTIAESPNSSRIVFHEYEGPDGHVPPKKDFMLELLTQGLNWRDKALGYAR